MGQADALVVLAHADRKRSGRQKLVSGTDDRTVIGPLGRDGTRRQQARETDQETAAHTILLSRSV
jgi:hypothetical protein